MKIITYTAITNGFDKERDDILCFTGEGLFHNPVMEGKIYKVLPHKFLDCDVSIWIDGNIYLTVAPEKLVSEFLGDHDFVIFKHYKRDCVYQEIDAIKINYRFKKNKKLIAKINQQKKYYISIGYPEHIGLFEANMIIRRHNKKTEALNEAWWAEICRWQQRDQVSLPVVIWKQAIDLKVKVITGNVREHEYFKYIPHEKIIPLPGKLRRRHKYLLVFFLYSSLWAILANYYYKKNSLNR